MNTWILFVYSFIAVDNYGSASINTAQLLFCNCGTVDKNSQCLFESEPQTTINAYVSIVQCKCSSHYIGNNCDTPLDYCALYKPCDPYTTSYNISYNCISYPISEQIASNQTYYCDGTCPIGFYKNAYGFCLGKNIIIISFNSSLKFNS